MFFIYSTCGLVCQSYSGRYMLMDNLGGYARSIQAEQKKGFAYTKIKFKKKSMNIICIFFFNLLHWKNSVICDAKDRQIAEQKSSLLLLITMQHKGGTKW